MDLHGLFGGVQTSAEGSELESPMPTAAHQDVVGMETGPDPPLPSGPTRGTHVLPPSDVVGIERKAPLLWRIPPPTPRIVWR
jgi:hypothetical protein